MGAETNRKNYVVKANLSQCFSRRFTNERHFNKVFNGILINTLLGTFLPAYTLKLKRRVTQAPKFYFHRASLFCPIRIL